MFLILILVITVVLFIFLENLLNNQTQSQNCACNLIYDPVYCVNDDKVYGNSCQAGCAKCKNVKTSQNKDHPCRFSNCGENERCVKEIKQCVRAPCPQYRCESKAACTCINEGDSVVCLDTRKRYVNACNAECDNCYNYVKTVKS